MAALRHLARFATPLGEIWRLALKNCPTESVVRPVLCNITDVKQESTVAEQVVTLPKDVSRDKVIPKEVDSKASDGKDAEPEIGYSYFKAIVQQTSLSAKKRGTIKINPEVIEDAPSEPTESKSALVKSEKDAKSKIPAKLSPHIKPRPPSKSASLSAYVNESETLQKLVKMNIDLSEVEKNVDVANFLVKADFESQVVPRFFLLKQLGIEDAKLPAVISKHPSVLVEDPDHMKVRVDYLLSKGFPTEDVSGMITRNPVILTTPVKVLDAQLGFIQQLFHLNGHEVRTAVTRLPKLAVSHKFFIQEAIMTFKEFLGFSDDEIKQLLLADPKLFLANRKTILDKYEYYREKMQVDKHLIMAYPSALRTRISLVRQRHLFLKAIGRDQFDPKKPNFVSLKALTSGRDRDFCQTVAKVPTSQYNNFLKTL